MVALLLPFLNCLLPQGDLSPGFTAADFKEVTAFAALLLLVFTIGWQQVKATREVKPELIAVKDALVKSTEAQKENSSVLSRLCEQMLQANANMIQSQNQLADRNMQRFEPALGALTVKVTEMAVMLHHGKPSPTA